MGWCCNLVFNVDKTWSDGQALLASDLNGNFNNVEDNIIQFLYQDTTRSGTTSNPVVTVKTLTISGSTFDQGFWVFVRGSWDNYDPNTNFGSATASITVSGVIVDTAIISGAAYTATGASAFSWNLFAYVASGASLWRPTVDVDVDVDCNIAGAGGGTVYARNFLIFGR